MKWAYYQVPIILGFYQYLLRWEDGCLDSNRPLSLKIPNVKFDFDVKILMYVYMLTKCSS